MMDDNRELAPCPFCGCVKIVLNYNAYVYSAVCSRCGASGPSYAFHGNKALNAWNHRTQDASSGDARK